MNDSTENMETVMDNGFDPAIHLFETRILSEDTLIHWSFTDILKAFKAGTTPCDNLISGSTLEFTTSNQILRHPATWKMSLVFEKPNNSLYLKAVPIKYHGFIFPQNGYHAAMEIIEEEGIAAIERKTPLVYVPENQTFPEVDTGPGPAMGKSNKRKHGSRGSAHFTNMRSELTWRLPAHSTPPNKWQPELSLFLAQCNQAFYKGLEENSGSFKLLIKFTQLSGLTEKMGKPTGNQNRANTVIQINENLEDEVQIVGEIPTSSSSKDSVEQMEVKEEHDNLQKRPKLD